MRATFLLAGLVLVGCGAAADDTPPVTTASPAGRAERLLARGAARVCVARPDRLASRTAMPVRDNGRLVGATRGSSYVCWLAAPGEHQITSVDDDTGPLLLHARAGGHYYLHQELTELAGALHAHLDWVDERTGEELVAACDDRVRVAVPGSTREADADAIAVAPALR